MTGTFLIMAASLAWALDTLIRYPLLGAGLSTLQIVLTEHLLLVAMFAPIAWWQRQKWRSLTLRQTLSFLVIGGLGSAIGTLTFTQAFSLMNPTIVILLQKLQPIVAISLAFFWLREPLQKHFMLWSLVVLGGSLLMIWPDIQGLVDATLHYREETRLILWGYVCTLIAVIAWGSATVFGKSLSLQGLASSQIMTGRFVAGLLVLLPLSLMTQEGAAILPDWSNAWKILGMVLISGLVGMALYYQGLKRSSARTAALAEMTFPVAAVMVNWLFLDIELTAFQIAGAAVLLGGNLGLRLTESARSSEAELQGA